MPFLLNIAQKSLQLSLRVMSDRVEMKTRIEDFWRRKKPDEFCSYRKAFTQRSTKQISNSKFECVISFHSQAKNECEISIINEARKRNEEKNQFITKSRN
jgi:hypothetical protein